MDLQSENFVSLITSYFGTAMPEIENPDWQEILRLADIHNLTATLFVSIKDKGICNDSEVLKRSEIIFNATVKNSVIQEFVAQDLIDLFNKNEICHILFKGLVLREYYPCKELRTMGDIDIVIKAEEQEKAHRLLVNNGFEFDEATSHSRVRNYVKNGVCFEVHTEIVSKNINDDVDLVGYFGDNFAFAYNTGGFTYEFKCEHHLIYLLAHMAKHFKFSGFGLRMILDIPVFVKHWQDKIDWQYVEAELKKTGLLDFSKNIFSLCRDWFEIEIPLYNQNLSKENKEIIVEYILAGGVFGYVGKNTDALKINKDGSKIKNILGLIFPSYEHLKERYVWFEGTPKWLLPVGWVRFWWFRLVKNKENGFGRLKAVLKSNDSDACEHNNLVNIIGLK